MTIATPHLATNEHNPLGISAQGQLMRGTGREGRCWFGPWWSWRLVERETETQRRQRDRENRETERGTHSERPAERAWSMRRGRQGERERGSLPEPWRWTLSWFPIVLLCPYTESLFLYFSWPQ